MSLLNVLVKIGGKLGVVKMVSTTAPAKPGKIPTRKVTLAELTTQVRAEEVRQLAQLPAELSVEFAKVFEAAGIAAPPHGWTIDRLVQVLSTEQYKTMDRTSAQKALLGMLTADKAHVHELVQEAIARDKAIDAFEEFARKKMDDRGDARQRQIAELQDQIVSLQNQIGRLQEESKSDASQWKQWHDKKVECEKQMAWAIGYLVEGSVVTIDKDH